MQTPDPSITPVVWDDRAILRALGTNPAAIRRALALHQQADDNQPTDWAIYQWLSRNKITARWRPRALYAAFRLGRLEPSQMFAVEARTGTDDSGAQG